jgi:hypothetical protein
VGYGDRALSEIDRNLLVTKATSSSVERLGEVDTNGYGTGVKNTYENYLSSQTAGTHLDYEIDDSGNLVVKNDRSSNAATIPSNSAY